MNLNVALKILRKYGISTELKSKFVCWAISDSVYRKIHGINDPLSEREHLILFKTFWFLGNKARGTDVTISENLKMKIVRNRHDIEEYHLAACGGFSSANIPDIIKSCHLNGSEEAELWSIFQKIQSKETARDCNEINSILGTYKIIESKLKLFGKINVLDVGSGRNGNGIATLTAKYEGKINGYGVDINIEDHPSNVRLVRASLEHLPFPDNFFHVIYSSNVIYYFKDKRLIDVLKEILRVLKPKGMFVFDHQWKFNDYKDNIVPLTGIKARVLSYGKIYGNSKAILIIKY